jgi:hypothetical protein
MAARSLSGYRPIVIMVAVCAIIAAVAVVLARPKPPEPLADLDRIREADVVEVRDPDGRTVLAGEFRSRTDALGNIEKDAALSDRRGARVIGEIELEIPAAGRPDRRPELEVDIIGLAPDTSFTVVIDDREVARFKTDDRGSIDMELQEGEAPRS